MRLLFGFTLLFLVFQWGYQHLRATIIEHIVIDIVTVKPSAAAINWLSPEERVVTKGHQIISHTTRLSILNGCEGTEAWFLLIAAILAYKNNWRDKCIGLITGTLFVYCLNQARIIGLYFALQQDRALFAALHGYVGPTLIVVMICLFFVGWIQWSRRSHPKTA